MLTTEDGNPLVKYWLEDGKIRQLRRHPVGMVSAGGEDGAGKDPAGHEAPAEDIGLAAGRAPAVQVLRDHFLADSPRHMTDKHYVKPSDVEFFEALAWLRGQILAEGE